MAAALARVVGGGAAARLSLAEMMGVRGGRVAPRGLGVGWRGDGPLGPAGRLATKTRFAKLCNSSILLLTINLRRDCASLTRVINLLIREDAASQAPSPQEPAPAARSAARESSNSQQLQDAPPRDPAGPAPRRAPEVDGRDDAPRRVDLEPREQVHWYETRRGTKAAFFFSLDERPPRRSDAVEPPREQAGPPPTPSNAVFARRLVRLPFI